MNPVTEVDGIAVAAREAGADMPWLPRRRNGGYARTDKVRTLTLADGSKRYQCAIEDDCTFTSTTVQAVTAGHGPKIHNGGRRRLQGDILDMTLRDFIAFVARNEQTIGSAETWRERALAAERRLASIERQFQ